MTKQRYYLAEWRAKKALSQEELEAKSGVDASTISAIENKPYGKRQAGKVRALAEALGIEAEDLTVPPYDKPKASGTPAALPQRLELEEWMKRRITFRGEELTEAEKQEFLEYVRFRQGLKGR